MKIKIIKADESKWYHHLIGKIRSAKKVQFGRSRGRTSPYCFVLRNYRTVLRTVAYNDAVIISD